MDPNMESLLQGMQLQLKSQQEQMNTQQERFLEVLSSFKTGPRNSDEKSAPKFDTFDVETEKWEQYFQRFEHHLDIYNISSDEKRRACLLSWVGASTYNLLQNLFGGEKLADKTYKELTEKLHAHFKDVVHVQAARLRLLQLQNATRSVVRRLGRKFAWIGKGLQF